MVTGSFYLNSVRDQFVSSRSVMEFTFRIIQLIESTLGQCVGSSFICFYISKSIDVCLDTCIERVNAILHQNIIINYFSGID